MTISILGTIPPAQLDVVDGKGPLQQLVVPVSRGSGWFTLVKAGEAATLDNANVTNVETQVASTREYFRVDGQGTNLIVSFVRDVSATLTQFPKLAIFTRSSPSDIWRRIPTKAAENSAVLAATAQDTVNTAGTSIATKIDFINISWDLLGFNQFVGVIEQAATVSSGSLANSIIQGHLF